MFFLTLFLFSKQYVVLSKEIGTDSQEPFALSGDEQSFLLLVS
jgi:hypothetical protein